MANCVNYLIIYNTALRKLFLLILKANRPLLYHNTMAYFFLILKYVLCVKFTGIFLYHSI